MPGSFIQARQRDFAESPLGDRLARTIRAASLYADGARAVEHWNGELWDVLDDGLPLTSGDEVLTLSRHEGVLYCAILRPSAAVCEVYRHTGDAWSYVATTPSAGPGIMASVDHGGTLFVGGGFSELNGDPSLQRVAGFQDDVWSAAGTLAEPVLGLYSLGGSLYARTTTTVRQWMAGSWPSAGLTTAAFGAPYESGATLYQGAVVVCSPFDLMAGAVNVGRIARRSVIDGSWSRVGSGGPHTESGTVWGVAAVGEDLYCGKIGGTNRGLWRWNGTAWSVVQFDGHAINNVYSLAPHGDRLAIRGAIFEGGIQRNAALVSDDSIDMIATNGSNGFTRTWVRVV